MRKISFMILVLVLIATITACGNVSEPTNSVSSDAEEITKASAYASVAEENEKTQNASFLIAYFTMPEDVDTEGIDANSGASIVVEDGVIMENVEYIAAIIQQTIEGDLFQIETTKTYLLDHEPLVDQAAEEQEENARPELSTHIENIDQYDTIFLGYPNWWGDMPMAVYSFLEEYDLSGKTIIPFCPHGGSGFSGTVREISNLQPNAQVSEDGLTISRNDVADAKDEIVAWVQNLGF